MKTMKKGFAPNVSVFWFTVVGCLLFVAVFCTCDCNGTPGCRSGGTAVCDIGGTQTMPRSV